MNVVVVFLLEGDLVERDMADCSVIILVDVQFLG